MREKLFEELKEKYKDYLYGKCSYSAIYELEEKLHSIAAQEAKDNAEIESKIKEVMAQVEEVKYKLQEEFDKEVGDPLTEELLEFLKFKGLIKGPEYYKRALKLKEKLEKNDKNLKIRKRAAYMFLISERGMDYNEAIRTVDLLLELGALYTGNFWMYEE